MKKLCGLLALVAIFVSASAIATNLDGNYKFSSRIKEGTPDMQGWQGTMVIRGNEMSRTYKSPDGKQEKFYVSTLKPDGSVYLMKHTKAYKPEYVGNEFRNKLALSGTTFTIESEDGKYKEVWTKQ